MLLFLFFRLSFRLHSVHVVTVIMMCPVLPYCQFIGPRSPDCRAESREWVREERDNEELKRGRKYYQRSTREARFGD